MLAAGAREEEMADTEETREEERLWMEKLANMDPAVPASQWASATSPSPHADSSSGDTAPVHVVDRQPGQSDEDYLAVVDPRTPASQWQSEVPSSATVVAGEAAGRASS